VEKKKIGDSNGLFTGRGGTEPYNERKGEKAISMKGKIEGRRGGVNLSLRDS